MAVSAISLTGYVGANVRRLREHKGLTQEELAADCKWDYRHVQRIEAGDFDSISTLVRVANALGVAPAVLLEPTPVERRIGRPRKNKRRVVGSKGARK